MQSLNRLGLDISPSLEHPERPGPGLSSAGTAFIEKLTFAEPDEILEMIHQVLADDWGAFPVWARNLSYRLACLLRPDDPELLREAAADLACFGPDWDHIAEELGRRAGLLEK